MIIRITQGFLKSAWWCVLVFLVLVALYLSLGRLVTLSVSSYQERIEQFLRDNGLQYVDIGELSGSWRVHDPSLDIVDLIVQPGDEPAIVISRVTLRLDSLRSLLNQRPIVKEIDISGLRLAVERDEERVWIRGFEEGEGDFDLEYILDSVPHLELLRLDDIHIDFVGPTRTVQLVSEPGSPWLVSAQEDLKHLKLPLLLEYPLPDGSVQSSRVSVAGYYDGDYRDPSFHAELFLDVPQVEIDDFLPTVYLGEQALESAVLESKIWMKLEPELVDVVGEIRVRDVRVGQSATTVVDQLEGSFRFTGPELTRGVASIPELGLKHAGYEFSLRDIDLALDLSGSSLLAGKVESIDVGEVTELLSFLASRSLVPERLGNALSAVSPAGDLQDILFFADLERNRPKLVSQLRDFSMDAFRGVPEINTLHGFISAEPDRGYLDIDNDAFQMNFTNLFAEAWQFDSGRGRVAYRVEDGSFKVTSGLIELLYGDLSAFGKLSLNLPGNPEEQTWGLTIGVQNARLLDAYRYVPNTIPDDLLAWLKRAIIDGTGRESGITIHGALAKRVPGVWKTHDLFFSVEDTVMSYDPLWPEISDLEGTVHVNSYFVQAEDVIGRVYNTQVPAASVFVPISAENKADTILVSAKAEGPFSDGIRTLNETPLSDITSAMATSWSGTGQIASDLTLNVPVGSRAGEDVGIDLHVSLEENDLNMADYDLFVSDLEGEMTYRNERGLRSTAFTGTVFNEPVAGTIQTTVDGDSGEVVVSVEGHVAASDLYGWSDQLLLSRAEGRLAYLAEVHVPYGGDRDEIYVEATSDLAGIVVDLPEPLAKADRDSKHEFQYVQTFTDSGFRIATELDDVIRASLKIEDGLVVGGRIHFGDETFGAVTYDAIRMTGHLPQLSYEDWMLTTEALAAMTDVSLEDEISERVASVTLNIDEFMVFDLPLEEVDIVMTREDALWKAHLRNDMLDGEVRILDEETAPLEIHLNRLSFEGEGETADPFSDVNPLEITDVNFSTRQLLLNGEDYGQWAFGFRTDEEMARFEELEATALGVDVVAGSEVEWRFGEAGHESRFRGDIQIDDLAEALRRFGFASSIEGEGLKISSDVAWQGSPAVVDVNAISGTVEIHEGKGRFVQAETGGALKLLGVFDFASLARRFRLDFSDVVDRGFEFSDISGVTRFNQGEVDVKEPIVIDGSSGKFKVGGSVDLNSGTLDNDMIVTLPVGNTLPWYAAYSAIATGPLAGATVMLAQKVFENQIDQFSSAKYKITGTIEQPEIEFVAIFDDKVRETEAGEQAIEETVAAPVPEVEPGE